MRWIFLLIFVVTAFLAISSVPKYEQSGMRVFENPGDVSNSFLYFALIIVFTAFVLILARKSEKFLKAFMYLLVFVSIHYVLIPFLGILSLIVALVLTVLLILKPNWITIDISALLLASGVAAMFGISLEPTPVIVLLVILAIYDAVSVYKTGHMIDLAESVKDLPLLFIIPGKDRPSVLGVGDVVIPNILVVSAQTFTKSPEIGFMRIPALTTLIGGVLGMVTLLIVAEKFKRPHAGLPFLNAGAIIGYLVGIHL